MRRNLLHFCFLKKLSPAPIKMKEAIIPKNPKNVNFPSISLQLPPSAIGLRTL